MTRKIKQLKQLPQSSLSIQDVGLVKSQKSSGDLFTHQSTAAIAESPLLEGTSEAIKTNGFATITDCFEINSENAQPEKKSQLLLMTQEIEPIEISVAIAHEQKTSPLATQETAITILPENIITDERFDQTSLEINNIAPDKPSAATVHPVEYTLSSAENFMHTGSFVTENKTTVSDGFSTEHQHIDASLSQAPTDIHNFDFMNVDTLAEILKADADQSERHSETMLSSTPSLRQVILQEQKKGVVEYTPENMPNTSATPILRGTVSLGADTKISGKSDAKKEKPGTNLMDLDEAINADASFSGIQSHDSYPIFISSDTLNNGDFSHQKNNPEQTPQNTLLNDLADQNLNKKNQDHDYDTNDLQLDNISQFFSATPEKIAVPEDQVIDQPAHEPEMSKAEIFAKLPFAHPLYKQGFNELFKSLVHHGGTINKNTVDQAFFIKLNSNVLDGTQIYFKQLHGTPYITLLAPNASIFAYLNSNKRKLADHLEEHLEVAPAEIKIEMISTQNSDSEGIYLGDLDLTKAI